MSSDAGPPTYLDSFEDYATPGVFGLVQPDAPPFRASPTWMSTHLIGQPSSISSTSTGLSSTPPDSTFVPPSLIARYQPSAPASPTHCGTLQQLNLEPQRTSFLCAFQGSVS